MKDYAEYRRYFNMKGLRDVTLEAFHIKLISNGEVWIDIKLNKNKSLQTNKVHR
jgi:hypothetical protein